MSKKSDRLLSQSFSLPEHPSDETEKAPVDQTLFEILTEARIQSGLTQRELADRTGMTQGDISRIEHGQANPSLRTLQRLAEGMDMQLQIAFIPSGSK